MWEHYRQLVYIFLLNTMTVHLMKQGCLKTYIALFSDGRLSIRQSEVADDRDGV